MVVGELAWACCDNTRESLYFFLWFPMRLSGMDIQTERGKRSNIDSHDNTASWDIFLISKRFMFATGETEAETFQLLRQAGKQNFVRAPASELYDIASS